MLSGESLSDCRVTRATSAKSAVTIMKAWGFDAIDVEYPTNDTEATNLVLLLKAVRDELDSYAAQHTSDYHFHPGCCTSLAAKGKKRHNQYRFLGFKPQTHCRFVHAKIHIRTAALLELDVYPRLGEICEMTRAE
ncbi:hypothetical protein BGZ61DRAFT_192971 [Ilyonectria robusta]|uniref:uncharacterized protein n=1 Tax=Ilyonectria robusta TaxID=1079257 RepID=UPI001E8D4366|nr:uncharacterized protein BGZ61DRAFT_192971 [Ilyonectria robusta]KAH8654801.1 hypothetical protein BGZ61DRAFT_192971 [Ilyonectria robusta]